MLMRQDSISRYKGGVSVRSQVLGDFTVGVLQVSADRAAADEQPFADFGVGQALRDEAGHLLLPATQPALVVATGRGQRAGGPAAAAWRGHGRPSAWPAGDPAPRGRQ